VSEVVGWDDDGRPTTRRGALTALAVIALLAGVVALLRSVNGDPPAATPTPAPSVAVSHAPPEPIVDAEPDPFLDLTVARRPARRSVTRALFARDLPGFVASVEPNLVAVTAAGGPEHAETLVGWCPASRIFQDATGTYRYDAGGAPYGDWPRLPTRQVRPHAGSGSLVDVSADETRFASDGTAYARAGPGPPPCPARDLVWPPLPRHTRSVDRASPDARRIEGRYVITTDTMAFCPAEVGTDCRGGGWEVNGLPSLPPNDLASEYVYTGEFVVQARGETGTFRVIRLPAARLVRRTGIGVAAVHGVAGRTLRTHPAGGVLSFLPYGDGDGSSVVAPKPRRDYVVRRDAALYLGGGRTGLGLPKPTLATLRAYLADRQQDEPATLWLILDRSGRVMRVVADSDLAYFGN
jgi:hypothetical protein